MRIKLFPRFPQQAGGIAILSDKEPTLVTQLYSPLSFLCGGLPGSQAGFNDSVLL